MAAETARTGTNKKNNNGASRSGEASAGKRTAAKNRPSQKAQNKPQASSVSDKNAAKAAASAQAKASAPAQNIRRAAGDEPFEPTPEKNRPIDGETVARLLIYAFALFICVCYMFPATAGLAGGVKSLMCGLFGASGFTLPALLVMAALFLRSDRKYGFVHWRIILSLVFMLSLAMFLHGFSAVNILDTLKLSELWEAGIAIKSGGAVGGGLGSLIFRLLGRAGIFIISIVGLICSAIIFYAVSNTEEIRSVFEAIGRGITGTGKGILGIGSLFAAAAGGIKRGWHAFTMWLRRLIGIDDNSPDSADVDLNRTMLNNSPLRQKRTIRGRAAYDPENRETDGYSGVRPSEQAFEGAISEIGIGRPPEYAYSSDTGEYIADSDRPFYQAPAEGQPQYQPAPAQRREAYPSPSRIEKHKDYIEIFNNTGVYPAAGQTGGAKTAESRPLRDMRRIEFNTPLYDTGYEDLVSDASGAKKPRRAKKPQAQEEKPAVSEPQAKPEPQPAPASSDVSAEDAEREAVVSRAAAAYAAQRRAEADAPKIMWRTPREEYTSTDRNGYKVPSGYCDDPRVYGRGIAQAIDKAAATLKAQPPVPPAAEIYNDRAAESDIVNPADDDDEPVVRHADADPSVSEPEIPAAEAVINETPRETAPDDAQKTDDTAEDHAPSAADAEPEKTPEETLIPSSVLMRFKGFDKPDDGSKDGEGTAADRTDEEGSDTENAADEDVAAEKDAQKEESETPKSETPKREYKLPPITLLNVGDMPKNEDISEELNATAKTLTDTLKSFKVSTQLVDISRGPTITRYELQPDEGVRVKQILNLVDDISLNLATAGVRIEAPIPGKSAVGVEVPNKVKATVWLRSLLENPEFRDSKEPLKVAMGMDVAGEPIWCNIDKMPHMLIAGATGMGKSVCINSMVISLLYRANPDDVKLIMIDPKKVELSVYNGLPHLLLPVVSEPKKAAGALQWAVNEMERRYTLIEQTGVRNIEGYNREIRENPKYIGDPDYQKCPYIVIFIDELADLMMTAPDSVEDSICRIAQKARAAGMHLVIGTQRPSVDVITGLIKANIPSRVACKVSSQMDSRVILDMTGAEKLIGRGDMLYAPVGAMKPIRVQGSFVSDKEVEAVVSYIVDECDDYEYDDAIQAVVEENAQALDKDKKSQSADLTSDEDDDPMLGEAIKLAVESGKISTSLIQRRLSLGYGRAAKLIDRMEEMGVVSPPDGQKPRSVLITKDQWREMTMRS